MIAKDQLRSVDGEAIINGVSQQILFPLFRVRAHDVLRLFPTDEIRLQIAINRNLRTRLANHLMSASRTTNDAQFNSENIKTALALNKEIQTLMKMKKEIPTMLGYCAVLDY